VVNYTVDRGRRLAVLVGTAAVIDRQPDIGRQSRAMFVPTSPEFDARVKRVHVGLSP